MKIAFNFKEKSEILSFDEFCLISGEGGIGKTLLLELLEEGFSEKEKNFSVDGIKPCKNDYNIIKINEKSIFSDEFKFTRNNELRKLIYDQFIEEYKESNEIIDNLNEQLMVINNNVNDYLKNITELDISFKTKIDNIEAIIDKNTTIIFEEKPIEKNAISINKMLLLDLYLEKLVAENENIILIDNIENFLTNEQIYLFLNKLKEKSHNYNLKVIMTTSSNNVFKACFHDFKIYKLTSEGLKNINYEEIIRYALLKSEHLIVTDEAFEEFYHKNISLIDENDLNNFKAKHVNKNLLNIGLLYTNKKISILTEYELLNNEYIILNNHLEYFFYQKLANDLGVDI